MASAAAELFVKVTADVKGLTGGFKGAEDAADDLAKKIYDTQTRWVDANGRMRDASGRFVGAAKEAGDAATSAASRIGSIGKIAIGAGLLAAGAAMGTVATQAVKLAGELEQNQVAFTTMLGSADKANKMLADLATFAASTPFELRGLTDSTKRLMAFGFSAESVIPIMASVGNAVAAVGGGKETLDGVTMALGQMAAKGKVSAEEMNQLAERGIPAWKMLSQAIGVSTPEAMKMAEKGAIDAGTAITALVNGMNKQFPDMMAKQSQTFNGAMSNLTDSVDQALTRIGKRMIESLNLTGLIQRLSLAINNLTAAFTDGGLIQAFHTAFGPSTKALIIGIAAAVTASMLPAIGGAVTALAGVAASLAAATVAAAPFIAAGLAIAAAAYVIQRNWETLYGLYLMSTEKMGEAVTWFRNRLVKVWSDITSVVGDSLFYINDLIKQTFGLDIAAKLGIATGKIGKYFGQIGDWANEKMGIVADATRYAAEDIASNFTYAFNQAQGAVLKIADKVTPAMLGLGKVADAAGKSAASHKAAEAQAKKHAAALERLHAAGAKAYERFESMAAALTKVQAGIRAAEVEGNKLGRTFDLAGAKAAAIKDGLPGVEAAFGRFSPTANTLRDQMTQLANASANGGKATADAFKVLDGAAASIQAAQEKAALLGEEFDANAAAVSQYSRAVQDLMEQGLKPGNAQLDEAVRRYNAAVEAQKKAAEAAKTFTQRLEEITSTGRAVYSALTDMAGVFGLQLPPAISKAIEGVFTLAGGFNTLMTVGPKLLDAIMPALTTIAAAAMANPVVAIVAGITAAAGIGVYAWNEYQKSSTAAMQAAAAAAEQARQELEVNNQLALESSDLAIRTQQAEFQAMIERSKAAFSSIKEAANQGFRDSLSAFISGASNYGEILREKIREGMAQAIIDNLVAKGITNKFDEYFTQIADNIDKGMGSANAALLTELEGKIVKQVEGLGEVGKKLFDAIGLVSPGAAAMAKQASDEAARLRAAHASTLNTIYGNLERGSPNSERLLAQARILQGRAQPGDEALARGMATGGLVTGPTIARMGEGGRNEAVLPLNENVYRQIGEGIAAARGGGSGVQLIVSYQGSGKWTREDAQGLGRLLVAELRSMGVRA